MQSEETAGLEASVKKIKQSPKFKRKKQSKKEIAKAQAKAQRLERERDQAVSKLKELEELLEKLPEIFESKFSQRLSPVLERQKRSEFEFGVGDQFLHSAVSLATTR